MAFTYLKFKPAKCLCGLVLWSCDFDLGLGLKQFFWKQTGDAKSAEGAEGWGVPLGRGCAPSPEKKNQFGAQNR